MDPFGSADIDQRARAYLHTNCAGCHQSSGPTPTSLDLRFDTVLSQTQACDTAPQLGNPGISNPRLIAPGEPDRSVLLARVNRRDANAMPPLASSIVDSQGVTLLTDWNAQLNNCM